MQGLSNKVAVVTGASKGIGAGIALRLAREGARVVVNYSRSAKEADAIVKKITEAGGQAVAIQADLSDPKQIEPLFEATIAQFGKLDILVNNAGIYHFGGLDAVTAEHFDVQFSLNVRGLLLATKAAVARFGNEGGVIINISSGVAITPMPSAQVYSATKGAVDVLTRGLALELGPRKIRVVGIAPGLTNTDGTSGMDPQMIEFVKSRTPLGRIGEVDDIAAAVAFVASADGGWITGDTIQVGGGLRF